MSTMNMSYKEAHEQFVSDHVGTTTVEIVVLASIAPIAVLLRGLFFNSVLWRHQHMSVQFVVDFLVLILTSLLCFTVLADVSAAVLASLSVVAGSLFAYQCHSFLSFKSLSHMMDIKLDGRRPALTNYRAFVNTATAICILAVDFTIFPRRLCKTETYGTGFMDVGVASFVFSNAIVAPEARGRMAAGSIHTRLMNSVKSTGPLWVLGFCRLASVKAADYQEHVTEYGVHWNFFFTLALIRVASTLVHSVVNVHYSWVMSLLLIAFHQSSLSLLGLREYILNESTGRLNLIAANREGIFSCMGYLALYLCGIQLGCFLSRPRRNLGEWLVVLCALSMVGFVSWATLSLTAGSLFDDVSRRLTNFSYFIWMVTYNSLSLAGFLAADLLQVMLFGGRKPIQPADKKDIESETDSSTRSCDLLEAINFNGLLYFLLANLFTGAVNMTVSTIYASSWTAMVVLIVYMLTLSTIVSLLHSFKLSVKFW